MLPLCTLRAESAEEHHHEDEHDEREYTQTQLERMGIALAPVKEQLWHERLLLPGEIAVNGDRLVHVAPRFEGTLKTIAKHVGESVQKGEVLATIQSNQSLSEYKIIAEGEGVVIDKDAAPGEFVKNSKVIFTIASFDSVWVNIAVHPKDLHALSKGTKAMIHARALGQSQEGEIAYVRPTLSEVTRTALVRMTIPNHDRIWLPGMFVTAEVKSYQQEKSLVVPSSSLVFMENKYKVFIASRDDDGGVHFEERDVSLRGDNGKQVALASGVTVGELVASGETFVLKAEHGKGSAAHSH